MSAIFSPTYYNPNNMPNGFKAEMVKAGKNHLASLESKYGEGSTSDGKMLALARQVQGNGGSKDERAEEKVYEILKRNPELATLTINPRSGQAYSPSIQLERLTRDKYTIASSRSPEAIEQALIRNIGFAPRPDLNAGLARYSTSASTNHMASIVRGMEESRPKEPIYMKLNHGGRTSATSDSSGYYRADNSSTALTSRGVRNEIQRASFPARQRPHTSFQDNFPAEEVTTGAKKKYKPVVSAERRGLFSPEALALKEKPQIKEVVSTMDLTESAKTGNYTHLRQIEIKASNGQKVFSGKLPSLEQGETVNLSADVSIRRKNLDNTSKTNAMNKNMGGHLHEYELIFHKEGNYNVLAVNKNGHPFFCQHTSSGTSSTIGTHTSPKLEAQALVSRAPEKEPTISKEQAQAIAELENRIKYFEENRSLLPPDKAQRWDAYIERQREMIEGLRSGANNDAVVLKALEKTSAGMDSINSFLAAKVKSGGGSFV